MSPVLLCVYLDGLLLALSEAKWDVTLVRSMLEPLRMLMTSLCWLPLPQLCAYSYRSVKNIVRSFESSLMLLNLRAWLLAGKHSVGMMGCSFL